MEGITSRYSAGPPRGEPPRGAIEALLWHYAKGKPKDEVSMDIVATTATLNTADVEGVSTERLEDVQAFLRQLLGRGD